MVVDTERRILVSVLLALALCPGLVASIASNTQNRTLQPLTNIDIWIDPLSWHTYYVTDCKEDGRIYGSFEVTYGGDIYFFICDRSNYDLWSTGRSSVGYDNNPDVGSLSYSLTLPHDGIWHIVFWNEDLFFSRHIEGTVYYSAPLAGPASSLIVFLGLLGIIGISLAVVGYAYSHRSKAQMPQQGIPSPQSQGTQVYAGPAQSYAAPRYCPSCGTPLRSPNDRFCSICGRQLGPGPELG